MYLTVWIVLLVLLAGVLADYFHEYQRSVEVKCTNHDLSLNDIVYFYGKCKNYNSTVRLEISPKHQGYGLFANRRIKKGELVIQEQPLFSFPQDWYEATEEEFTELMLEHVFPNMTETEFDEYLSLADAFPDDPTKPFLNRLVYSNVFDLNDRIGLFLKIARINHSCKPSILYSYTDGFMKLYAARDIEPNEELHLSYVDTLKSKAERQQHLLDDYGFICDCEICSANITDDLQKERDQNRRKLNEVYNYNSSERKPEENVRHMEDLMHLAQKEDLAYDFSITGHIYYEILASLTKIPDYFKKYSYNVSELGRQVRDSFSIVYGYEFVNNLFAENFPNLLRL